MFFFSLSLSFLTPTDGRLTVERVVCTAVFAGTEVGRDMVGSFPTYQSQLRA